MATVQSESREDILQARDANKAGTSVRNEAIDFLKGFLVAGMVIFHAINYFALQFNHYLVYIKFVSGGFVLISGYTVAAFYLPKWKEDPRRVTKRLIGRGVRLVALFAAINFAISAIGIQNHNGVRFELPHLLDYLFEIFILGQGRLVAFEILLPIGYTLMAAPFFLWVRQFRPAVAMLCLAASVFLFTSTWHLGNPTLLILGVIGMLIGLVAAPEKLSSSRTVWLSGGIFAMAVLGLSYLRSSLAGYVVYMCAALKFFADICVAWRAWLPIKSVFLQFGRYALFCYLAHIAILQVALRTIWRKRESEAVELAVIVTATWLLMIALITATGYLRRVSKTFDTAFRFLFA